LRYNKLEKLYCDVGIALSLNYQYGQYNSCYLCIEEYTPKTYVDPPLISITKYCQVWQTDTVNWYGGETRKIEYITFTCLWYHAGCAPVTLRIVLVKTPDGKNAAETFFSTDIELTPSQIIHYFVLRWNIEVTFEETRAHLGVETQRQWSDKAIARTTPLLMGLFSFVTLIAFKMHRTKALVSMEMASWYDKKGELTFSDILAIVRRSIWSNKYFSKSENQPDLDKCSEETINTLIYQLSFAA
jgi:hypothetical protein